MRINLLSVGLLLMSVLFFGSCVSNKKFKALEEENAALQGDLAALQKDVQDLRDMNTSLTDENMTLEKNLNQVQEDLQTTQARVSQVEKENAMKSQKLDALNAAISEAFADLDATDARVKDIEGMLYLDLDDNVNFGTASAALDANDNEAIDNMAKMLMDHPNLHLVVEGNADKRSINNDNYKDNWELSSARSIAVVRKLIAKGVNPDQLTAAGRAEFNPADTGDSAEAWANNRRIELMVIPKVGKLYKVSKEQK